MIESFIKLGIKGSELVATQLKEVQKKKDSLEKTSTIKIDSKLGSPLKEQKKEDKKQDSSSKKLIDSLGSKLSAIFSKKQEPQTLQNQLSSLGDTTKQDPSKEQKKEEKQEPSKYGENLKTELANAKNQAISSIKSFNGAGLAQAGIMAVSSVLGPVGTMVGQALNNIIDGVIAFKDKIKSQLSIAADTAAKNNDIHKALGDKKLGFNSFVETRTKDERGKKIDSFTRSDISKSEQATILNSISGKMGALTEDFRKEAGKLFFSEDGKRKFDVAESTQLAQGNFATLGSDKGFFMQQISNGFGNLPPSMKQKLTSQMFSMLDDSDRNEQTDYGRRSSVERFDNLDRVKAEKFATGTAVDQATKIQNIQDKLDTSIGEQVSKMIKKVEEAANSKDISEFALKELKGAMGGLGTAISDLSSGVSNLANKVGSFFGMR